MLFFLKVGEKIKLIILINILIKSKWKFETHVITLFCLIQEKQKIYKKSHSIRHSIRYKVQSRLKLKNWYTKTKELVVEPYEVGNSQVRFSGRELIRLFRPWRTGHSTRRFWNGGGLVCSSRRVLETGYNAYSW